MPNIVYYGQDIQPIANRSLDTPNEIAYWNNRGYNVNNTNYLYEVLDRLFDETEQTALAEENDEMDAFYLARQTTNNVIRDYENNTGTAIRLPASYIPYHESFSRRPIPFFDLTGDNNDDVDVWNVDNNNNNDAPPPPMIEATEPPPVYDFAPPPAGVNRVNVWDADTDDSDSDLEPLPLNPNNMEVSDDDMEGAGHIHSHNVRPFFAMN